MKVNVRSLFLNALRYVESAQLLSGDVPCFRPAPDLFFCPCPLLSTLVHDALGYFDPQSILYEPGLLDVVSAAERRWIAGCVTTVRWRIRLFIAWQEDADGTWQLFGREGTSGPDPATTACCATALLRPPRARETALHRRVERVAVLLRSHRTVFERAQLLRFLALAGQDVSIPAAALGTETADPNRACSIADLHAAARAWRQAALPGAPPLATRILALHPESGNDLNRSLAASALADLECRGEVVRETLEALIDRLGDFEHWANEPYANYDAGSRAAAVAVAASAVARLGGLS